MGQKNVQPKQIVYSNDGEEKKMYAHRKYLKEKYQVSSYQIAQIEFLFKTIFSELSKMLIMGILFHRNLDLYLCALCVMFYLRSTTGGLHFYTYIKCLACSALFIWLAVFLLPRLTLPSFVQTGVLLISLIVCYLIGPVVSKYRPEPSPQQFQHFRNVTCMGIFVYAVILYVFPENRFTIVGFWIIVLHSLQLTVAKIRRKGGLKL